MASDTIRIVIVVDQVLLREGIIALLEPYRDLEVVGAACDREDALDVIGEHEPNAVLLDVRTPGTQVITTVTAIRHISPNSKVIVLGSYDTPGLVPTLLDLGVRGYLLKDTTAHQLIAAIRGVNEDNGSVALFVSRKTLAQLQGGGSALLSGRERDVLELVALALSNAQIAARLSLTEATVKRHLRNAFVKLGAVSRIDAVNKATATAQISRADYAQLPMVESPPLLAASPRARQRPQAPSSPA